MRSNLDVITKKCIIPSNGVTWHGNKIRASYNQLKEILGETHNKDFFWFYVNCKDNPVNIYARFVGWMKPTVFPNDTITWEIAALSQLDAYIFIEELKEVLKIKKKL